ncbi:MAG: 30S ribosome-binding factor RbfA [Bdellovibrio sp.]
MRSSVKATASHRMQRFEKEIRQIVADFLLKQRDELPLLSSVSRVKINADLKSAQIWMHLGEGDPKRLRSHLTHLNSKRGELQSLIARKLGSRFTPRLEFEEDPSYEQVLKIESILQDLRKDSSAE